MQPEFCNNDQQASRIYACLADHQRKEDWDFQPLAAMSLSWAKRFNLEFKLQISEVALCFDSLPVRVISQFHKGYNGFGLRGQITLNTRHLTNRPTGAILGALLHELIHAWQHEHGRPSDRGRHNRQFRKKAAEVGLIVSPEGRTEFAAGGPFEQLATTFGFTVPHGFVVGHLTKRERPAGESRLKKWVCSCAHPVNVRVAVADFQALCLRCNTRFRLESQGTKQTGDADVC